MSSSISNNGILSSSSSSLSSSSQHRILLAFWLLGLFNNSCFVIMLSCAKLISEGGTALVFICNVMPGFFIKLSAPYWFDSIQYQTRIIATSLAFVASFTIVASFHQNLGMQLFGVAFGSLGGGLGEASLLALAGKVDEYQNGYTITAFASGTGLAGVFGFSWYALFVELLELSINSTLYLANILPLFYLWIYIYFLSEKENFYNIEADEVTSFKEIKYSQERGKELNTISQRATKVYAPFSLLQKEEEEEQKYLKKDEEYRHMNETSFIMNASTITTITNNNNDIQDEAIMSFQERFQFVSSLWPYMIPLYIVYVSEYALQSGAWTSIGFPIENEHSRNLFYEYSNWTYQSGVFLSRSSGTIYQASMTVLWILPILQFINLLFFCFVAVTHSLWYSWSLLVLCFIAGLLGGSVYVNAFTRINKDMACNNKKEFALGSASVADSIGILVANILGLFIQACLYQVHDIDGAVASCPF